MTDVAVDVVVLALRSPSGALDWPGDSVPVVLLRRRSHEPFVGVASLPGGHVGIDEDLEEAARRILSTQVGLDHPRHLEQLATFGRPDRDPRGRIVSVSYLALLPRPAVVPPESGWYMAAAAPHLAFDHAEILTSAIDRLRARLTYSTVAYGLLPDTFTLSDLQAVYSAVLGRELDKRNFRRRVLALGMLAEAEGQRRGSHRPAQLYRFARDGLVLLDDVIVEAREREE